MGAVGLRGVPPGRDKWRGCDALVVCPVLNDTSMDEGIVRSGRLPFFLTHWAASSYAAAGLLGFEECRQEETKGEYATHWLCVQFSTIHQWMRGLCGRGDFHFFSRTGRRAATRRRGCWASRSAARKRQRESMRRIGCVSSSQRYING